MPSPRKYRQTAGEFDAIAEATQDAFERKVLLQVAVQLRRIANHREKELCRTKTVTSAGR